jgi:glutamyl-tRNA synthetase
MQVVSRFAPSPTGYLHIGNVRTAIVNYLFTKKMGGKFILRLDDTDVMRSKPEYADGILEDLTWLGIKWDELEKQSDRIDRYEKVKQHLIAIGRLYPCYETPEELDIKRKMQLNRGLPPIYDRSALKLTDQQKQELEAQGKKPHYRFLLEDSQIKWDDLIRGENVFEGKHLSDPVLVREDNSMTYILCSVIDDIDMNVTHIVRGEDHVTNTAIQMQIFDVLEAQAPTFAHLALIRSKDAEISKRTGGFDIRSMRSDFIEAMTINSMVAKIGTSDAAEAKLDIQQLIDEFDINKFSRSPANYDPQELIHLNHKYLSQLSYDDIKPRLVELGMEEISEIFWEGVKGNISKINELVHWWQICTQAIIPFIMDEDKEFLQKAIESLPEGQITVETWDAWIESLKKATTRKGKNLFMPLRKALTGKDHGPELKYILPIIGRNRIMDRLNGKSQ